MASITTIEQCRIAPSPGAPTELFLKLLHFDMLYLSYNPMKHLIFYEFKCSESHFVDTVVPNLKNSLSLALKHFLPLAGKILIPHNSDDNNNDNRMPVFHYVAGEDYVPLTIAICDANFESLAAYHSREGDELHDLVPSKLPPPALLPDSSTVQLSLAAFQVTLFPTKGVCIGITGHHSVADATGLLGFLHAWSSINRSNVHGSPDLLDWLPSIDRDFVADGDRLAVEFWKAMKSFLSVKMSLPTARRVQATFVLTEAGIKALEGRAFPDKRRDGVRLSSFVLASAHMWTCLARSAAASGEEVDYDEPEYFICAANCRRLLNPPLPNNYFGNCLALILVESTHGKLRGKGGFLAAAEAIGGAIRKVVDGDSDMGIMDVSYRAILETARVLGKRTVVLSGSERLDFYATDYGWGRPVKFESLRDNNSGSVVFVGKSREYRGGMEMSVLIPKPQMDAFTAFFTEGLPTENKLCCKM